MSEGVNVILNVVFETRIKERMRVLPRQVIISSLNWFHFVHHQDLFNVIYGPKIIADFKAGKLDENGNPVG